jgi:hypothetical protein
MAKRRSKKMRMMGKQMGRGGVNIDTPIGPVDFPVGPAVKAIMAGPGKSTVKAIVDFMKKKDLLMSKILPNLSGPIKKMSDGMLKDATSEALTGVIDGFKAVGGRRGMKKMKKRM